MANEPTLPRGRPELVRGGTLEGPGGLTVTVGADPITIGRDASADLTLDDPSVSALHCELRATPRGVALRDLGSTNGTRVDSLLVSEATLIGSCTLYVGDSEVRFVSARAPSIGVPDEDATELGALRGGSSAMRRVYQMLRRVGPTELSVLVTGETGTGKELAARALHDLSPRAKGPFVVIDCSALPGTLAESILFGHEKGAFTGAVARANGAFQSAHGGTVFLDELGELPDELQPKLLRAVAERSVQRVGSNKYETVDVRVVAATRRDLRREINARRFREDLYFRIAQTRVEMPPLRSRVEDIPAIVAAACARVGQAAAAGRVAGYIQGRLGRYDWPGNVRELVNVASVLAALGDVGSDDLLPLEATPRRSAVAAQATSGKGSEPGEAESAESFARAKRAFEETYFRRMLESSEGNVSEVARRVGLARHQVRAHLKKLGLSRGIGKDE